MIEFESVGKTFRDGTAAVVDLSLTVPSDKITVIVGPSGCGKTTTLRMINRMIEPTAGRIVWDGSPLRSRRKTTLRRQMGYVIQSGGLFPHRTVLENVGTVPGLLGWEKSRTRKRSLDLLDSVGLDRKLADRYPAQLSGGQQQRVGVARALAADPLVMLMDEPFSAVDPVVRAELHELFLDLQRQLSKTIVLITHDIDEAIKLGDQVAILRVGGRLAQVGTPQELLDEPADSFVEGFVGRDRGYRALSFSSASTLTLDRVKVVRDPAAARGGEPTLVVDGDAKPLGWVDAERSGQVTILGATFDPERDTLRSALDSALTSPVGLAVAVPKSTGRYAGVVSATQILASVTQSRAALASRGSSKAASPGAGPPEALADSATKIDGSHSITVPAPDKHADLRQGAGRGFSRALGEPDADEPDQPILVGGEPAVVAAPGDIRQADAKAWASEPDEVQAGGRTEHHHWAAESSDDHDDEPTVRSHNGPETRVS
ncbi:MAG TPA: ABC transporter ATP-binding protein [Propionibacteriaceae bacterium]|nr:ABC transporter ATP-binding protein [Propionibacteriaceae bacterium]